MRLLEDIAKESKVSGVGRRRDIRMLSTGFLALHGRVKELEEILYKLKGGKPVKRVISYSELRIGRYSDYHKHNTGSITLEYEEINRLLGFGLVTIGQHGWEYYEIKGPEQHVQAFLFLTRTISRLIQDAYNDGFEDGKKIMTLLAAGKITLEELNNRVIEGR